MATITYKYSGPISFGKINATHEFEVSGNFKLQKGTTKKDYLQSLKKEMKEGKLGTEFGKPITIYVSVEGAGAPNKKRKLISFKDPASIGYKIIGIRLQ